VEGIVERVGKGYWKGAVDSAPGKSCGPGARARAKSERGGSPSRLDNQS